MTDSLGIVAHRGLHDSIPGWIDLAIPATLLVETRDDAIITDRPKEARTLLAEGSRSRDKGRRIE